MNEIPIIKPETVDDHFIEMIDSLAKTVTNTTNMYAKREATVRIDEYMQAHIDRVNWSWYARIYSDFLEAYKVK